MTTVLTLPQNVEGRYVLQLRQELRDHLATSNEMVVDCQNVQCVSPAAQALLLAATRRAECIGGHLHLRQPSASMVAALRASGLHRLLRLSEGENGERANQAQAPADCHAGTAAGRDVRSSRQSKPA